MDYKNALVFTAGGFVRGGFRVENGRFAALYTDNAPKNAEDLGGALVIPGLVDMHIHGAAGADFSDGDAEGLLRMGRYLAAKGVTSFAPTSMSLPGDGLRAAFISAAKVHALSPAGCARIAGIHMEGPYLSKNKKGAQNAKYLKAPELTEFKELYESSGGLLRVADIAPELPGAAEFIRAVSPLCRVSVAHTDADYTKAAAAFDAGASHLTHLFNAMPPIHHRSPGVIGAASEREHVTAELICDGRHVHPAAVRMAFKLFPGRICLVSDALRCCGMREGEYTLGGQTILLKDSLARLPDGTIAGAAADLFDDMRHAVAFGIPMEEAIRAASSRPAEVLGLSEEAGSIAPGRRADFVVCGPELMRRRVCLNGQIIAAEE